MIWCPGRGIDISIDEYVLQGAEDLFIFRVGLESELIINVLLQVEFVLYDFLDLVAVVNSVFEYFFDLGVVGVEPDFALLGRLVCIDEKNYHWKRV